jgi:sulfur carrier protein ThiS
MGPNNNMTEARVVFEGKTENVSFSGRKSVMDVLRMAGVNPDIVLIRREGKIIPDDTPVKKGDRLEAMKIVSGG